MKHKYQAPPFDSIPVNNTHLMIGKVASLYDISVQTLRHYDKIGLFRPDLVNEETGYRYYTIPRLQTLELILFLRRLDLSLAEIQEAVEMLEQGGSLQEVLLAQSGALERKIQELQGLQGQIQGLLHMPEVAEAALGQVCIREFSPPRHLLYREIKPLPMHRDNFPAILMEHRKELLGTLPAIQTEYSFGATVSRSAFRETGVLSYSGIFLDPGLFGGKAPRQAREIPSGFYATIRFDRHEMAPEVAYDILAEFLETHNFRSEDMILELALDPSFSSISKISRLTELQVQIYLD